VVHCSTGGGATEDQQAGEHVPAGIGHGHHERGGMDEGEEQGRDGMGHDRTSRAGPRRRRRPVARTGDRTTTALVEDVSLP
jgi:hypothetical protein